MNGCIIYGGSFNPVHIGHLRLAVEASSRLANSADRLEFVPTARHPQKNSHMLLPIALRMELIEASIRDMPGTFCNGLEEDRSQISYTIDTLKDYLRNWQPRQLYFLLGSQDYELFHTWRQWQKIAQLCNLLIVPRGDFTRADFERTTRMYWPQARPENFAGAKEPNLCMTLPASTRAIFLPVQWLPISSSWIRELWLNNENPLWLLPPAALEILKKNSDRVNACWNIKE